MPVPQSILDSITAHAVSLDSFEDDIARKVLAILEDLQEDLRTSLISVDPASPKRKTWRYARLQKLLEQTDASVDAAYAKMGKELDAGLQSLAAQELDFAGETLRKLLPIRGVGINTVTVSPSILRQLARDTVVNMGESFGALPFRAWLQDQAGETRIRYAAQVTRGIQNGEGIPEMVRRVVGGRGREGVLKVPRHQAETLVRTSTQAVMGESRRETYRQNSHVVKGVFQISIRDARTSITCLAYAGKRWKLTEGGLFVPVGHTLPYNGGCPRHGNCRGIDAPWTMSLAELGVDPESVPEWVRNALDGNVPQGLRGEDLLKRDDRALELLGPGRFKLLRSGKISVDDLVSPLGTQRTLEELQELVGGR